MARVMARAKTSSMKTLQRKGLLQWDQKRRVLICDGVPIASVVAAKDPMTGKTFFYVQYQDKIISPGVNGYADPAKGVAHLAKRFNVKIK